MEAVAGGLKYLFVIITDHKNLEYVEYVESVKRLNH